MTRIVSLILMAMAGLYLLELSGVVPERKFFPSLPRLEASAADPASWTGAAQWGLDAAQGALDRPYARDATLTPSFHGKFTDRVVIKSQVSAPII